MGRTRRQKRRDDVFRPAKKDFDSAPPNVMHRERILNNEKTTELTEHCAAELAVDVTRYFDAAFKYDRQKHEQ